jgi:hypothetical protein
MRAVKAVAKKKRVLSGDQPEVGGGYRSCPRVDGGEGAQRARLGELLYGVGSLQKRLFATHTPTHTTEHGHAVDKPAIYRTWLAVHFIVHNT